MSQHPKPLQEAGTQPEFEVVAMAASAGGLGALSKVLAGIPADFPASIVIVQHLDPRHRSLMADILSRRTQLDVGQARRGDRVSRAGCI